jgi:hypothetical protein
VCTASDIAIHRFTEGGELLVSKTYDRGGMASIPRDAAAFWFRWGRLVWQS